MKITSNENGFAMLSVFLIGVISMTLISIVFYVLNTHTNMSGQDKRYQTELEAAKGASEYIMAALRDASLTCNNNSPCTTDDSIDIHGAVCTAVGKPACADISATYLSEVTDSTGATVVAVEVTSTRTNGTEKAIVEFVYKVF